MTEPPRRSAPLLLSAALGGTLAFGFLDLLFGFGWTAAEPMLRERAFVVFLGNGVAAVLLTLLLLLFRRRPSPTGAYLLGMALSLGAFCAGPAGTWAGLAVFLAAAFGARSIQTRLRLPDPVFPLLGLLALLVPIVSLLSPGELRPLPVRPPPPLPAAPARSTAVAVGAERPDVLLLVADTLRADVLLDPALPTPNLDRLRQRGAWSPAAVAPSNQTLPSHLSLLCALDIEKLGMRSNLSRWPSSEQLEQEWGMVTLAERFAAAGYRTAAVSSNPLLSHVPERGQDLAEGFEAWDPLEVVDPWWELIAWKERQTWYGWLAPVEPLRRAVNFTLRRALYPPDRSTYRPHVEEGARTTSTAVARIAGLAAGTRPYFLFVNYYDPHTPYIAPPPYAGTESAAAVPDGYRNRPLDDFPARVELRRRIAEDGGEGGARGLELGRFLRARYREEVLYLDQMVGELLDAVERGGRPTLVLFTGDHGEMFGDRGSVEHSTTLFEGEIAVPLILAGPGVPPGLELAGAPELVDAAYTLLRLTGAPARGADGRHLLDPPGDPGRVALSVMRSGITVRKDGWKLHAVVRYAEEPVRGEFELDAEQLYDLGADPGERNDLSAAHPERVEELLAAARERLQRDLFPLLPAREFRPGERKRLSDLGYVAGEEE
ncbi:MAG: sulfatase-like hydrolase/transferase [Planctomycetes bacterium]|nr:sulfatase-like hydrolase/transferase [Planctomycetota bacterium]